MAKKQKGESVQQLLSTLKQTTAAANMTLGRIPDIVTFCEHEDYLNLPAHGITLFPMQKLILRCFYRGSEGNEHVEFTPEEIQFLKDKKLDNPDNGDILSKIATGSVFRELVLVWGRRCLSEDTIIVDPSTGREWSLGEMWDYGKTEGIMSWTYDQRTKDMRVIPNCNLLNQGVREVFRLTTSSGHEIEATSNHPFLTQRGWVNLSDIKIGEDSVALVEEEPFFGTSDAISEDEAAILGYITGDGCCSQSSVFFTCANDTVREDFERCLNLLDPRLELFHDPWTGAKSKEFQYKVRQKGEAEYEKYFNEKTGKVMARRSKQSLQKLLIQHGLMGKTCHYKTAPKALFECPKNVIAAYLRALYSCDGSYNNRRSRKNQVTVEFSTVNKDQAYSIARLLRRFGIVANVRKRVQNTEVKRENKKYTCTSYNVHFTRGKYVETFMKEIGMLGKSNSDEARQRLDQQTQSERESVVFHDVKSIATAGEKRTFDLQVSFEKSLQNFTAQGFISHNSGKDFLVSIIALYEALKLIEAGNPYAKYGLGDANPISILTIATNAKQAEIAFNEIKSKIMMSKYFKDKVSADGLMANAIYLQTPKDVQDNLILAEKGMTQKKGSVLIESGNSNSDGFLGKGCFVLLLDEVASYGTTGSSSSGDRIYTAMTPAVNTYVRNICDHCGNKDNNEFKKVLGELPHCLKCGERGRKVYDGKIISISSPRGKEGILWDLFRLADTKEAKERLVCRCPTWNVNLNHTRDSLRESNSTMTDEEFEMEFGAEFSGTGGINMFGEDEVLAAFDRTIKHEEWGKPGIVYFAHLDPALSSHNYALCVCHKEVFYNKETKAADFFIVVDHLKVWQPMAGRPIIIDEVDQYMLQMNQRFHFGLVTYDQWNCVSASSYLTSTYGQVMAKDLEVGDAIYGCDGQVNEIVAKELKDGVSGFRIKTKFGYSVECTENHPLLSGGNFVEAKDLNVGDKITISNFESFGTVHKVEWAAMSGYVVSEGSVYRDHISFHNTEMEVINDYMDLARSVGLTPKHYLPPMNHLATVQPHVISFRSAESRLLKDSIEIKNGDCFTKEVPDFVMRGDRETVAAFLSCLYEGDGNTCRNPNVLLVEYNTASRKLAEQIHILLLQFGIKSSLKYYENKYFRGKKCPFYRVSIYGDNIDIFAREIGFRSSRKNAELAEILRLKNEIDLRSQYNRKNRGLRKIVGKKASRSRQMWDRIVSIEPIVTSICHLEVSGDHTYVANGLISHNSASSIAKLRRAGIPSDMKRFNSAYKMEIYDELAKLLVKQRIKIPHKGKDYEFLRNEMLNLQRAFTPRGFRIFPKKDGDVRTDDAADALAGAMYNALMATANRLPQTKLAHLPVVPSGSNRMWQGMQGPYGYGSGSDVANRMRRISSPSPGQFGTLGGLYQ